MAAGQTPEQKAREEIDRQLAACGWMVQGHLARYFDPPLTEAERSLAMREGWILGIY